MCAKIEEEGFCRGEGIVMFCLICLMGGFFYFFSGSGGEDAEQLRR